MKHAAFLALAGALALTACGDTADETATDPNTDMTVNDTANTGMTPPAGQAAVPASPQEFVDMAAASDMFEIESARLAQEMGSSQAVKDFAAMMIEDHTTSSDNLKSAAAEVEPALTVAPKLTAGQQAQLDELRQAGDRFDAVYKQQQVAAHEQALALLLGYADSGGPEPLTAFAGETAAVVEGHLDHARGLSAS